jgi:endonuclease-3
MTMDTQSIRKIFSALRKANPHPTTELIYHNAFELLVSVILSAQATDKAVNKATAALFQAVHSPEEMLALGEARLRNYIKSIGLYKNKAKNIILACRLLVERFHSQVPAKREELEALPGVGRKTANMVLNTCFKEPVIAVDTHIFRVAQRLGLAKGKTPLAIEEQLMKVIPKIYLLNAHHWLILHGRYVCTARKPKCPECALRRWCAFSDKTKGYLLSNSPD